MRSHIVESKRCGIQKKSYAAAFARLKGHTIEPLQLLHRSFHFWIMIVDIELRHLGACHLSAVGNGNVHFKFGIGGRDLDRPYFQIAVIEACIGKTMAKRKVRRHATFIEISVADVDTLLVHNFAVGSGYVP